MAGSRKITLLAFLRTAKEGKRGTGGCPGVGFERAACVPRHGYWRRAGAATDAVAGGEKGLRPRSGTPNREPRSAKSKRLKKKGGRSGRKSGKNRAMEGRRESSSRRKKSRGSRPLRGLAR